MKTIKTIISLSILCLTIFSNAQDTDWCGFNPSDEQLEDYQNRVENIIGSVAVQERPKCINKTLSVHIHIVRENSETGYFVLDSIYANIDSLNSAFAPICVSFEVCKVRNHNNSVFSGVLEEEDFDNAFTLWGDSGVINLFYFRSLQEDVVATSSMFPEEFIAFTTANSNVLIHEMGHYFGLIDTHESEAFGDEMVSRENCETTGDLLCDTEADPDIEGIVGSNCNYSYGNTDTDGDYYTPPLFNFMSNSNDDCKSEFSPMQWLIMLDVIVNVRTNLH